MLDRDLAELYGVTTSALNQSVKRNQQRFPEEFMFQLTLDEYKSMSSQFVTTSWIKRPKTSLPNVFTEQGVVMLSAVLKSPTAVQVCIIVMKAFIAMRNYLSENHELIARLESLDRRLLQFEQKHIAGEVASASYPPIPKKLSDEACIVTYSERALAVFTNQKGDRRLLKSIGARYNNWLTWQGERVAGWVFPKSCAERLLRLLPDK